MVAVLATLVVGAAIVTFAAVYAYRHTPAPPAHPMPMPPSTPPPPNAPTDLAAEFIQLATRLNASMGLAVSAVGSSEAPLTYGDWQQGPAWSTSKVPLAIAAYRQQHKVTDKMRAAITESDNAAAEALWQQLGDPSTAAQKVQQILQETGDPTIVESRKVRPEFTAFGQTIWSLVNQTRFIASAFCNKQNEPIFALMGQIAPQQSWGIGTLTGAQFKGGWGPSPSGRYLVRQLGILNAPSGKLAVAIAAEPASGSFEDGRRALDEAAAWLSMHLAQLPSGQCK
ncbi:serine hydrolase [Mycobacterium asiaticum]|uniref:serine hydrolase n=1 Tax=Mycobacterium asiaticum TaxID=1790 RepID=UPI000A8E855E|nr:serine hydrolase [Mycobacterium asiaticum]